MNKLKKLYLKDPIFKFMISYSLILLLPLLVCLIGYNISFDTVEKEIKDNNLAMLNHSKGMIDGQISSLNTLSMQIATNPTINSLAETVDTEDKVFYYDAPKAIKSIADLIRYSSINIIENIYIYLGNTEYIITPTTLYQAEFFYTEVLGKTVEEYKLWKESLLGEFKYNKYVVKENQISYIQSIPVRFGMPSTGAVIFEIDEKELAKLFSGVMDGFMTIQDEEGNILFELGTPIGNVDFTGVKQPNTLQGVFSSTINREKMIGMYTISSVNRWTYTLFLPEKIVMHKLSDLRTLIFLLFGLTLVVGVTISYYLSLKNGRPIREIIKNLRVSEIDVDLPEEALENIDNLGGAITKIVSKTQMLKDELDKQQPLMQTAFFQKLILGEFTTEQELQLLAERAKVTIEAQNVCVVACRVFANNDFYTMDTQTLEEVNVALILIQNTLKELFNDKVHFYDIDYLTTVIIVEKQNDNIEKKIKEANAYLIANYHITPSWGISNECQSWLEIWRAYEQAKRALLEGVEEGIKNIISYHEILEEEGAYYYPLAFEKRLIGYTKSADTESIKSLFEILWAENIEKRTLSSEVINQFYIELDSTIIKMTGPEESEPYLVEIRKNRETIGMAEPKKYFDQLSEVYMEISQSFKKDKKHRQMKLINNIITYIDEVYADSNLGLGMIASRFNISEGYISSLFKEQTGINFTEYVENLRINKACNLLKDTELNINDIGEKVGYNSVQSFRRAFKRIHGVSPSELRKMK